MALAFAALLAHFACNTSTRDEWGASPGTKHASGGRSERATGTASASASLGAELDVGRGLFERNCASCHGLDGSGQGTAVLDRPARNFKDGGFSFGNTADAVFNTISYGIPGTPMPAFGDSLDERERHVLAAYVRTLCPSVADVEVAETIMTVKDTPLIVRGILPPIVDGAPLRPRGLLIGLPGGLSFEYRIDDLRLLGVRQGNFVERTDWNGRGGTPLRPLGGLIWTDAGGDPPATFSLASGQAVARRLLSTFGDGLKSELVTVDGESLGDVEERLFASHRTSLNGFAQSLDIGCKFKPLGYSLTIRIATPEAADLVAVIAPADEDTRSGNRATWQIFRRTDGVYECIGVLIPDGRADSAPSLDPLHEAIEVMIDVPPYANSPSLPPSLRLAVHRVFTTEWSESIRAQLVAGDS